MSALFSVLVRWMLSGAEELRTLLLEPLRPFMAGPRLLCPAGPGMPLNLAISRFPFPGNVQDDVLGESAPVAEAPVPQPTITPGFRPPRSNKSLLVLRTRSTEPPVREAAPGMQDFFRSVEHLAEGALVLDEDGRIAYLNPAFRRIFHL